MNITKKQTQDALNLISNALAQIPCNRAQQAALIEAEQIFLALAKNVFPDSPSGPVLPIPVNEEHPTMAA